MSDSSAKNLAVEVSGVSKYFPPRLGSKTIKGLIAGLVKKQDNSAGYIALEKLSFSVRTGEFFGIVGRNGCGKSTLLKMIAGVYTPTTGHVKTNGRLVPFIELGVGFNPELSGRDNVFLNGALIGFSRSEMEEMYEDIVSFAELEDHMDVKLKNFSSGMQVRLAFSVAIRANADILVVDEVLAVGDTDFQRKCYDYFLKLKSERKTVIFVSHDMSAVRLYCDRAILIDGGNLIAEGDAQDISEMYLKMFDAKESDEIKSTRTGDDRWGSRAASIAEVVAKRSIVESSEFSFDVTLESKEKLDNLILGFSIKNNSKEKLIGTNSAILDGGLISLTPGKKVTYRIKMPNIFSSGMHYIDVAIQTASYEFIDNWKDAAAFEVTNRHNTPYKITPLFTVVKLKG